MYYKKKNPTGAWVLGSCLLAIFFILAMLLIVSAIIMGVWNWVLVPMAHFTPLEWPQAVLIYLGLAVVFGAIRGSK